MSRFDKAIQKLLEHEGGYVNHASDTGGATNWGISLRFLQNIAYPGQNIGVDYVRNLSISEASKLYKKHFWDKIEGDKIKSYPIAYVLFDQAVNKGPHTVINQVRDIFGQAFIPMTEQGAYMPSETLSALNRVDEQQFLKAFIDKSERHYQSIIQNNPSQAVFASGWLNRIASLENYAFSNLGVKNASMIGGVILALSLTGVAAFFAYKTISAKKGALA